MDAPISLKNPRRETESTHSDAPLGNSRCIISWKSELPASSSRLRQNSGPFFFSLSARTWTRSSLPFLPGQTSSRCGLPFWSSLFISDLTARVSSLPLSSYSFAIRHFHAWLSHAAPSGLAQGGAGLPGLRKSHHSLAGF